MRAVKGTGPASQNVCKWVPQAYVGRGSHVMTGKMIGCLCWRRGFPGQPDARTSRLPSGGGLGSV